MLDKIMRLIPSGPAAIRCALSVLVCICALAGAFSLTGQAQLRSVHEVVYSAGQASPGAQIAFPTARTSPAPAATSTAASLPPPEGNLAEVMRAIAFPNANILFNLQLKDPAAQPKKAPAASPFDYVEWGSTVYPGWLAVDQAAVAIAESAPLLLTPGRRCQNGRSVPVDRADWKQYVAALAEVGRIAHRASQARNYEAFGDISEKLNDACANCHKVYRDKGGSEGSGAARCQ